MKIRKPEPRKILSLASYVDPSTLVQPPPGKRPSAASMRKAMYAEKDRARPVDPGVLDFVPEDDEGESSTDAKLAGVKDETEKARKQALLILQARSEIPEEGM